MFFINYVPSIVDHNFRSEEDDRDDILAGRVSRYIDCSVLNVSETEETELHQHEGDREGSTHSFSQQGNLDSSLGPQVNLDSTLDSRLGISQSFNFPIPPLAKEDDFSRPVTVKFILPM